MKLYGGLEKILADVDDNVKDSFRKFKNKIEEFPKYLDEIVRKTRDKISEYGPIIVGTAISALPLYAKTPILSGLYIINTHKGPRGKVLGYGLIGVGIGAAIATGVGIILGLHAIHSLPSSNHIQYLGKGYEAFVPNGQTINYNGQTDPVGDLILSNGTTLHNVIWNGQYASTIINNHNQIVQLNSRFVGQADPVNNQPYVPLQDFYVIKGQVPIEQTTINGQTYYVIEANKINPADIAGFYTYDKWVPNFVAAMNTPGTYAAGLPGNSPVFQWTNTTGTVAYQTMLYEHYIRGFSGGYVLVPSNETIVPYGYNDNVPGGAPLSNFISLQKVYNTSS